MLYKELSRKYQEIAIENYRIFAGTNFYLIVITILQKRNM